MKNEIYSCFEDYPEDIQREANEIFENKNVLEYFQEVVKNVHIRDETAIELILFSVASLFIENSKPVHQQIKGDIGTGKTSLLKKTLKLVPERYIHTLNNITPEYLYYTSKSSNEDYNIFFLDDVEPTRITTSLLNILTDNTKENKVFIQSKNVELNLQGKNLFFCIFTEENMLDKRLENELLPNKISNTTLQKSMKIKRDTAGRFDENSSSMQHLYCVANAIFEKLIENPLKVFNHHLIDPYTIHSRYRWDNTKDVQRLTDLTKARAFYYQKQSKRVDDIILGTKADETIINRMLQQALLIRDYNLSMREKDLIQLLEPYTDGVHEQKKEAYKTGRTRNAYLVPTYENIAQDLGITKDILINWVKGKGLKGEKGLEEKCFVKPMKIDPKKRTSPVLLYLDPRALYIQEALAGVQHESNNRQKEMEIMKFDEYMIQESLKLLLMIENVENCNKVYECRDTFMKKNRLQLAEYEELATYLKNFKNQCIAPIKK